MPKRSYIDNEQSLTGEMEMSSMAAPPQKQARGINMFAVGANRHNDREDESERRSDDDERQENDKQGSAPSACTAARAPAAIAAQLAPTKGIILRSGRIRLPDKLIQYLNNGVAPEALFWQGDGQGFSIDCEKVQADLLDNYFHGTKLSSFLRSLNRWGFKRLFYHSMPKTTLSFHHPLFRRDCPDLCKDMNMGPCSASASTAAPAPEPKKDVKPAPVAVKLDANPVSSTPSFVASIPATTNAGRNLQSLPQNQVAALNSFTLDQGATTPGTTVGLQSIIDKMRAQVAAEAANKDLLLRQALAAEQQRSALMAQANNNNKSSLDLLEGVLRSLVSTNQPVSTPSIQLVALASALSGAPASNPPAPPAPAQPPAAPTQPAPAVGSLLQLLSPAQQLELLNQLTGAGSN